MYLIFDTETTGLPKKFNAPVSDSDNWPRMVQLAWQLHDRHGKLIENDSIIVKPEGYDIPFNATKIHGITTEKAEAEGIDLVTVLEKFENALEQCEVIVGHNLEFDINIVGAEHFRKDLESSLTSKVVLDTKDLSTDYCALPGGRNGKYKWPNLSELHHKLFGEAFDEAHNAAADVNATARAFFELARLNVISKKEMLWNDEDVQTFHDAFPDIIEPFDIEVEKQIENFKKERKSENQNTSFSADIKKEVFFHFHNHSSFSILTATSKVTDLVKAAQKYGMPAVGLTDLGNMMGAFHFMNAINNANKEEETPIIPILGCEVFVSEEYQRTKFTKDNPDRRFNQLLLAKNIQGYRNLSKISSVGYTQGYYAGYPRVGKEVIEQYKENLIATTGGLLSEIPQLILNVGEGQAEEAFRYWHELFGEDFYVELIRHGLDEENHVNQVLMDFAKKYGVKVLAQNNTFYIDQKDAEAHDILLCVRDGEKKNTPIGRGRDYRFGFPNDRFHFRSQEEMADLFVDIPEAIHNHEEFLKKFEPYQLAQDVLLPAFAIPEEFKNPEDEKDGGHRGENAYLRHLTYEGAKKRYGEITEDIKTRLDFELQTIENTGYPGYFLIVQDFTTEARNMGVSVGPGRGSAAGSAVAYCIGITNVDPIKYDLLFERFLNPDRVSLPDIDIDFDDRGRDKVIEWVVNKYGKEQVAQIITYGTMAGKSAIRDTGRVLDLPLPETDRLAKRVHLGLNKLFDLDEKSLKQKVSADEIEDCNYILKKSKDKDLEAETIRQAKVIEGSLRNTGIHACGVIITPKPLTELVPVAVAKDADLLVTQFDNAVVENAGLLKMDFLGLRTLTIIMDAVDLVKQRTGETLVPDDFPLDDPKTFEIFQKGQTVGIFQYESPGMQKNLKLLKPDKFDDLIAMNALYRPGPLQYIPNFIARKHGKEKIEYDLPDMEEYLAETYGITVYQEQVMLLSQKLAGFSKGEADVLRKAMGKKQRAVLDKMKASFIDGATERGHDQKKLEKIWTDWESFAQYAFNKSHSTCYAMIAYQTAYLKAHHPAEYMAAVLSNNMNNIKTVSFFMEECRRMGMKVLGPDVNESAFHFTVNDNGNVRFGMGAIKGVGQAAVEKIVAERKENGLYKNVFDFVKRIDLRAANKKTMENLVLAGAFDELDQYHRGQYFYEADGSSNLEKIIKFGVNYQESQQTAQASLFDDSGMEDAEWQTPSLLECPEWSSLQTLLKEKEVVGIYISDHPLSEYELELNYFTSISLNDLNANYEKLVGRELYVGGIVSNAQHRVSSKNGNPFGLFTLEDFSDQTEFRLFGEDYLKWRHFLTDNQFLHVKVSITQNPHSNNIYINPTRVVLLSEVLEKQCAKIELALDITQSQEGSIDKLMELIQIHKGEKNIQFILQDPDNRQILKMPARKAKVNVNKDFINGLKEIEGLRYNLN